MPKSDKTKVGNKRYVQPTMGKFFSKSNNKSSSKQSLGAGESSDSKRKEAIRRAKLEENLPSQRKPKKKMLGNNWAAKDTEEYRTGYPGKKDYPEKEDNMLFYTNQLKSKPDGDLIDNIHDEWFGDYGRLERHHGYIQWLFPIRETGLNWHSQELQLHEIKAILADEEAKKRVLTSYKLMLDFYGMKLTDEETGEIERADNWRDRFRHLNRSFHNYLRITRILKCLGEFEYEHLKPGFVKFVLKEGFVEGTLDNLMESCEKYWIPVIRDDAVRKEIWDFYDNLYAKKYELDLQRDQKKEEDTDSDTEKPRSNDSAEDEFEMDNSGNKTLEIEISVKREHRDGDGDGEVGSMKPKRPVHELSSSDEEKSQEAKYWQENENKAQANRDNGSSVNGIDDEKDEIDLTENSNENQNEGEVEPAVNKAIVTGSDEVHEDKGHCKDGDDVQKRDELSDDSLVSKDEATKEAKMVEETVKKTDATNENKMNMDDDGDKVVQSEDTHDKTEVSKTDKTNLKIDGTECEMGNDTEIMDSISGVKDNIKSSDNVIDTLENATENLISDEKCNEALDGMDLAADVDKEKNGKINATEDVSGEKDEMEEMDMKIGAAENVAGEKVQKEETMKNDETEEVSCKKDEMEEKNMKISTSGDVTGENVQKQENMNIDAAENVIGEDVQKQENMNIDAKEDDSCEKNEMEVN